MVVNCAIILVFLNILLGPTVICIVESVGPPRGGGGGVGGGGGKKNPGLRGGFSFWCREGGGGLICTEAKKRGEGGQGGPPGSPYGGDKKAG